MPARQRARAVGAAVKECVMKRVVSSCRRDAAFSRTRAPARASMEGLERRTLFAAAGDLDPAFGGGDGKVVADFGNGGNFATDMAVFPDGRFVVSGVGE